MPRLGETGKSYKFLERGIVRGVSDYARSKLNGRENPLQTRNSLGVQRLKFGMSGAKWSAISI